MSVVTRDQEQTQPLSRFDEDALVEDCVCDIINDIFTDFNKEITNKWLRSIENPLMVDIAMYKLSHIVHLATVEHDGAIVPNEPLELLVPDEEPLPAAIDNWARGSVPARVVKANESRFNEHGLSDGTRTPSVSSFRSSSSRSRSTASRNMVSRGGKRHDATQETDNAPRIIELDDENSLYGNDNGNMNGTGHMYDMLQRQKNRLKQLTHTDDTVKDEFQLLQEEVDRAAEDLKGKNYIFDQSGHIVMINPLKSDQLPPFSFNPSLNVSQAAMEGEVKQKGSKKKTKKIRVAGSRNVDENGDKSLFTPTTSLATTIAGSTREIQLNNGVAIEAGVVHKEGPPIPVDPRKPSRKEYFSRNKTAATTSFDSMSWDEQDGGGDTDAPMSADLNEMSITEKTSTFTGGSRYKDIDPFEGGRAKSKDTGSTNNQTAASSENNTARSNGSSVGRQKPAVEPTKPSYSQQTTVNLLHGGSHMQGPRDRLPSQILQTRAEKKKYVINAQKNIDETDAQSSVYSHASKKGSIKKETLARELF